MNSIYFFFLIITFTLCAITSSSCFGISTPSVSEVDASCGRCGGFDPSGGSWGNEIHISHNTTENHQVIGGITYDNNGGFLVMHASSEYPYLVSDGNYTIIGQFYNSSGSPKGNLFQVIDRTLHHLGTFVDYPVYFIVRTLQDGRFVLIYRDGEIFEDRDRLFMQFLFSNGSRDGGEILIHHSELDGLLYFQFGVEVLSGDGNIALTTLSNEPEYTVESSDVIMMIFHTNGSMYKNITMVNTVATNSQRLYRPGCITSFLDTFVIAYRDFDSTLRTGLESSCWAQRFWNNGSKKGIEFRLDDGLTDIAYYHRRSPIVVSVSTDGKFVAMFHTSNTSHDENEIAFYQKFHANDTKDGEAIALSREGTRRTSLLAVTSSVINGGSVFAAWSSINDSSGDFNVYGQFFDSNGDKVGDTAIVVSDDGGSYDQKEPIISPVKVSEFEYNGFFVGWTSRYQDDVDSSYGAYGRQYFSPVSELGSEWIQEKVIGEVDPDLCSGHGECVEMDVCQCNNDTYFGVECNITTCGGVMSNVTESCGEYGECENYDDCTCQPGYIIEADPYFCVKFEYTVSYFEFIRGNLEQEGLGGIFTCSSTDNSSRPGGRSRSGNGFFGSFGNELMIMFGGYGYASMDGQRGHLNDLWTFNIRSKYWCYIKGSNLTDSSENHFGESQSSVFDEDHSPGSRSSYAFFSTVFSFFVLGGQKSGEYGFFQTGNNYTNELWELALFPTSSKYQWRQLWNQEDNITNLEIPTKRSSHCASYDSYNNIAFIFGGGRYDNDNEETLIMNDLWKYDVLTNVFELVQVNNNSSSVVLNLEWNSTEFYSEQLTSRDFQDDNLDPPHRHSHLCWSDDKTSHFYVFGGTLRNMRSKNDVWMFNTTSYTWGWVSGTIEDLQENQFSIDEYQYDSLNFPASRSSSILLLGSGVTVVDNNSNDDNDDCMLFFGGLNQDSDVQFSDLWSFSNVLWEFKFVNGSKFGNDQNTKTQIGSRHGGIGGKFQYSNTILIFGGVM